jgi:hypothetical protein
MAGKTDRKTDTDRQMDEWTDRRKIPTGQYTITCRKLVHFGGVVLLRSRYIFVMGWAVVHIRSWSADWQVSSNLMFNARLSVVIRSVC